MAESYEEGGYFAFILACADGTLWQYLSLAHDRKDVEDGGLRAYQGLLKAQGRVVTAVHFVGSVPKSYAECQKLHEKMDRKMEKLRPVVPSEPKKTVLVGPGEALW